MMKRTIKTLAFAVMAVIVAALTFTSCDKDEDNTPSKSYIFTATITPTISILDADYPTVSAERSSIAAQYMTRLASHDLSSSSTTFTVEARSLDDAIKTVKNKCAAAEAEFTGKTFTGTHIVTVTTNGNDEGTYSGVTTTVYSKTFGPASK